MAHEEMLEYVLDQLSPLGRFATKRMFGCWALFADEAMFALINSDGRLYLKVSE